MRFTALLLAGAFAIAHAQYSMSAPSSSEADLDIAAPSSTPPPESPSDKCLKACAPGDSMCQSHCIAVPAPDKNQVARTHDCIEECKKTSPENKNNDFGNCQDACIKNNYYNKSSGTPKPTDAPADGSSSGASSSGAASAFLTSDGSSSATGSTESINSEASAKASATSSDDVSASSTSSATHSGSRIDSSSTGLAPVATAAPAAVLGLALAVLAL